MATESGCRPRAYLDVLTELAPAVIVNRAIFGEPLDPEALGRHVVPVAKDLAGATR